MWSRGGNYCQNALEYQFISAIISRCAQSHQRHKQVWTIVGPEVRTPGFSGSCLNPMTLFSFLNNTRIQLKSWTLTTSTFADYVISILKVKVVEVCFEFKGQGLVCVSCPNNAFLRLSLNWWRIVKYILRDIRGFVQENSIMMFMFIVEVTSRV